MLGLNFSATFPKGKIQSSEKARNIYIDSINTNSLWLHLKIFKNWIYELARL